MTSIKELNGKKVSLFDNELIRRREINREYLMMLSRDRLLQNYRMEAGRYTCPSIPEDMLGGWESPTCQLRGHFAGHWLSAAAFHYHATGDEEVKARAERVIDELAECQKENGNGWAAAIPEKYLHWIAKGKAVWAPQYTIHKIFMGLADMAQYAGSQKAISVAIPFAEWFLRWAETFTREEFENILDVETGGMLEVWAQLYALTKNEIFMSLMEAYYRGRLFDALTDGKDVLTNMHANTTIPEVLGCALAYDVTGQPRWREIVEAYWDFAVTKRGAYATGGQTDGEIWTPMQNLAARLGDKNQEFCTVYNMMRLADFLFRRTGDAKYADYREQNIYNGVMAQTYKRSYRPGGNDKGVVAYFLPLMPGGKKDWGTDCHSFFCCHGTSVQANASLEKGIYYQDGEAVYVCQYFDSKARFEIDGTAVKLTQRRETLSGWMPASSGKHINDMTSLYASHPDAHEICFTVEADRPVKMKLHLRSPYWLKESMSIAVNGEPISSDISKGFAVVERVWEKDDKIVCRFVKGITAVPLPGSTELVAFQYGPVTLAGLCETQHTLHTGGKKAEELLTHAHEREWGSWKDTFISAAQEEAVSFIPLYDICDERYTVYFRVTE